MRRRQVSAAFFFAVLLFLLYQFYLIFAAFLTPLAWAALLALVFYPAQTWLTAILRGRSTLAALLLTTLVIALVIIPTIVLTTLLVSESSVAYERLQQLVQSGALSAWVEHLRLGGLAFLGRWMPPQLAKINIDVPSILLKITNAASGFVVAQATGALKNVVLFVVNFFLTTFALFFFFRDGERLVKNVRVLIPMEAQYKDAILGRFYDTLTAVVQGALVVAAAQGALAGLGYWLVGMQFAVLLGCATGFLSLMPSGSALIWVPVCIYLGVAESWLRALALFVWCFLVVSSVDNVLRPWIIGGRTQISTLLLFFGILGGLQVYGFLGMFLAPVLIATLVAFVQIYREQYAVA